MSSRRWALASACVGMLAAGCPESRPHTGSAEGDAGSDAAHVVVDGNAGWATPTSAPPVLTACSSPRLGPRVDLLNATSVLTDVVSLGDRWAIAFVDSQGVATAKVATLGLDGQVIDTVVLGSPALEPRLAAAGTGLGTLFLAAGDPARRSLPFWLLGADLVSIGGSRDLAGAEGFDQSRLAVAWNGDVFGALLPTKSPALLIIRSDGSTGTIALGDDGDWLSASHNLTGIPGGFSFAVRSSGKAFVKTRAVDGRGLAEFELPATTLSVSLNLDPTTDRLMGAAAGADIQIFDDRGQPTPISTTVGSPAPRIAAVALGTRGGQRTTVVAWTGPQLNGILYHVTGVNSAAMPYFKAGDIGGGGQRLWLTPASDSVGIFVSGTAGAFRGNFYFSSELPVRTTAFDLSSWG